MDSLVEFDKSVDYRSISKPLPKKPVSLPYELRTEMTWLDFCNPANPLGTPKSIVQAMHTALVDGELAYAPDRDGHLFCETLSQYFDIDSSSLLLGGSVYSMIHAAALAFEPCTVGITSPCLNEYVNAICNAGHSYVELSNDVSFAATDVYTAQRTRGRFHGALLSNPGFPSSRLLPRQVLIDYLETCSWVIVDESFVELSFGGDSVVDLCERYSNLIVVRNISSTFAMLGTPISYIVAHPDTIACIRQFYDGTEVSMFAEVLAKAFVSQQDYLEHTHEFLDKEIPWMMCNLSLVPGLTVYPTEANFVLCRFDHRDNLHLAVTCAQELFVRLQLAGFLVRKLVDVPGLDSNEFFAVILRTHEDNERLLDALRRIVYNRD